MRKTKDDIAAAVAAEAEEAAPAAPPAPPTPKRIVGCVNVGIPRNICGCVVPQKATVYCREGLFKTADGKDAQDNPVVVVEDGGCVRIIEGEFYASPEEVARYCNDWPADFEPVYE